ncbi:ATP-dependent DNA helicase UvrD2 [compost metagenome]
MACAGSGKTTVLCQRVLHLLACGVDPSRILVLSFSKTAASEVQKRLVQFCEPGPAAALDRLSAVRVSTCHAFANRLIRVTSTSSSKTSKTGKNKKQKQKQQQQPALLSPTGVSDVLGQAVKHAHRQLLQDRLINKTDRQDQRQWLKELGAGASKPLLKLVATLFDYSAASGLSLEQVLVKQSQRFGIFRSLASVDTHVVASALRALHSSYQALKLESNRLDFSDMVTRATSTVLALSGHETGGRAEIRVPDELQYRYILVDEYQDSSASQVHFIAALARSQPALNIMVFGDEHQSVYRFAGAFHTPLCQLLPDVLAFPLTRSYRLPQALADASTAVLAADGADVEPIKGRRVTSGRPVLVRAASLSAELRAVAQDVQALLDRGEPVSSIAVLARTSAALREAESELLARGIVSQRRGVTAKNTDEMMNVLKLVRGVERGRVQASGHAVSATQLQAMLRLPSEVSTGIEPKQWTAAASALRKVINPSLEGRYKRCADIYLVLCGGIKSDLARRDEVRRWIPLCALYPDALAMRDSVRAMTERSAVTTSTIHQAKGSEWKQVFVIGVADGQMPNYLEQDDDELIEERNLMYVAMTRARETLRLYYAPVAHARSRRLFEKLSRFLDRRDVLRHFDVEDRL